MRGRCGFKESMLSSRIEQQRWTLCLLVLLLLSLPMSTNNGEEDSDDTKDEKKVEDEVQDDRDSDRRTEIPVEREIWEGRIHEDGRELACAFCANKLWNSAAATGAAASAVKEGYE